MTTFDYPSANKWGSTPLPIKDNLEAANEAMSLSKQERDLYTRHLNNLYGNGGVDNPDGSRSTLYQSTVNGPDGKVYSIPTVWNGKILDPKDAVARVEKEGWDKFPSYDSVEEAESRYQEMHKYMEKDTERYFQSKVPQ